MMNNNELVEKAYRAFKLRNCFVPGRSKNSGKWFPSKDWEASCCENIRSPSCKYPYSLLKHCASKKHIMTLLKEKTWMKKQIEEIAEYGFLPTKTKPKRACEDGIAYKRVEYIDGRLFSLYDDSEYIIGQERKEQARKDHEGGFYVYEDKLNADEVHPETDLKGERRFVTIKCKVAGNYCRYGDKLAFSRITPLEILRNPRIDIY